MRGGVTECAVPTPGGGPLALSLGPDGNLWFVERLSNQVARITRDGVITEFALPALDSVPAGIVFAPPGPFCLDAHLWFTEFAGDRLGKVRAPPVPSR
ncbi:hypothetical protein KRR26_27475 [Corallococcus sp. M34]|uniref:virginiamycin B lyase family protein n=1 Tax=Citreicoccus inhibens TaxID=2849499 RepID=UPI001C247962|nr:hypothetical protein [Citreicoccus inhibens]MBU8899363.1 hypothetical protein [Citreicoccus inhibens]